MKQVILFLFTILVLSPCKEKINSVADVMKAISPDKQKFTIDASTDNIIKGEKGTLIFIPADALRFQDGTTPTGKVKIELKEFFSVSDFISNNLSSVSDSFLLETGGMLFISATSDGRELAVDSKKSYVISFPKNDSTKRMELFYGDNSKSGRINWQTALPIGEGFGFGYDSLLVDSTLYDYKIRNCGWAWLTVPPDSNVLSFFNNKLKLTNQLQKEVCDLKDYLHVGLYLNENGKVAKTKFEQKISTELDSAITKFFKILPPFNMKAIGNNFPDYEYMFVLCCHKEFNQEKYAERFKQKYSVYRDKAIEKMDKGELGIYVFSATKFGWINCDRFYNDQREKIDYIVKVPDAKEAKVMIIFDEVKSIMNGNANGNDFVFKNVPISSKIKVIGISFKDGKPLLSKMPAIVSKQSFPLSGFKKFSLKELEKELNN